MMAIQGETQTKSSISVPQISVSHSLHAPHDAGSALDLVACYHDLRKLLIDSDGSGVLVNEFELLTGIDVRRASESASNAIKVDRYRIHSNRSIVTIICRICKNVVASARKTRQVFSNKC